MTYSSEDSDKLDVVFSGMSQEQINQAKQQMNEFLAEGLDEAVTEDDTEDTIEGGLT